MAIRETIITSLFFILLNIYPTKIVKFHTECANKKSAERRFKECLTVRCAVTQSDLNQSAAQVSKQVETICLQAQDKGAELIRFSLIDS